MTCPRKLPVHGARRDCKFALQALQTVVSKTRLLRRCAIKVCSNANVTRWARQLRIVIIASYWPCRATYPRDELGRSDEDETTITTPRSRKWEGSCSVRKFSLYV